MKPGQRMPFCVGTFAPGDAQCDGDRKSADENERRPCVYRDRCFALQRISEKSGRALEHYVTLRVVGDEKFAFALSETLLPEVQTLINDYRINGGVAAARRRNRPLAIVAPKKPKEERALNARQMAYWLFLRLSRKMGKRIYDGSTPVGQLFIVDRSKYSNYKSLYIQFQPGKKRAIVAVYAKPSRDMAEVRIAFEFQAFLGALSEKDRLLLKPSDYTGKDGAFNVKVANVTKEKASLIADRLAPLISARV